MPTIGQIKTYCLFCQSGSEGKVISHLERQGLTAMAPLARNWAREREGVTTRLQRLLPGYVFFEAANEPQWHEIAAIPAVLRILRYGDGQYALRGRDSDFAEWVRQLNGLVEISLVIKEGSKLRFVSGPLQNIPGKIIRINTKRKVVAVRFSGENDFFQTVWCSYDYLKQHVDSEEAETATTPVSPPPDL